MPAIDPVILQLRAETQRYRDQLRTTTTLVERQLGQQERSIQRLEQQFRASSADIGGSLKGIAGSIAGYFTGRELAGIIDEFTQFQNKLKVAGVEGDQLKDVQDRLFASAQKYGVSLGALGGLFGSLTQASKELGASQQDVFKLTDSVSAALKVSGASAGEAQGALLQLGQALRGGTVQAEEYNSLLDGLFPLLQAAANGSDKYGGSVAKLTAQVKAGEVTSREFFAAILAGSQSLEGQAAKATLTLSAGYTTLTNALTVYVGEAASTSGVQSALANGLTTLADNIDLVVSAIAVIAATMGVKYVASAGAATIATITADAALLGLTTRAEVAGFAIGALGRAFLINGAIAAVVVTLGVFASEISRTDALTQSINTSYDEMRQRLAAANAEAGKASSQTAGVGSAAAGAVPGVNSLSGAVANLAVQLYKQADAAKKARIELAANRLARAKQNEADAAAATPAGRQTVAANNRAALGRGDLLGIDPSPTIGRFRNFLSGGRTDREAQDAYQKAVAVSQQAEKDLKAAYTSGNGGGATGASGTKIDTKALATAQDKLRGLQRKLEGATGKGAAAVNAQIKRQQAIVADLSKGVSSAEANAAAPSTSAGRAGPSAESQQKKAEREATQRREEQERIAAQIADAQTGYLNELAQTTQSAAERAVLETQAVEATRAANALDINQNEKLNAAQRAQLIKINDDTAALRTRQVQDREAERLRQQQIDIATTALRGEDDLLQRQSQLADTTAQKRAIELRRVEIAERLEQASLLEELKQAAIAKDTDRIAAARKGLAALSEKTSLQREVVNRDNEGSLSTYLRTYGNDPNAQVQDAVVEKLKSVDQSITDAAANALGVKDPLLKSLLQIFLQQNVLKPLYDAFSQSSSSGSGIGGLFSSLISSASSVFGGGGSSLSSLLSQGNGVTSANAVSLVGLAGGGTIRVNGNGGVDQNVLSINGQAVARVNRGEDISVNPNARAAQPTSGGDRHFHIAVDARNSVTPSGFANELSQSILTQAAQMDQQAGKATLKATPGYVAKSQQLGGPRTI